MHVYTSMYIVYVHTFPDVYLSVPVASCQQPSILRVRHCSSCRRILQQERKREMLYTQGWIHNVVDLHDTVYSTCGSIDRYRECSVAIPRHLVPV